MQESSYDPFAGTHFYPVRRMALLFEGGVTNMLGGPSPSMAHGGADTLSWVWCQANDLWYASSGGQPWVDRNLAVGMRSRRQTGGYVRSLYGGWGHRLTISGRFVLA
jgi:hypothetical protein